MEAEEAAAPKGADKTCRRLLYTVRLPCTAPRCRRVPAPARGRLPAAITINKIFTCITWMLPVCFPIQVAAVIPVWRPPDTYRSNPVRICRIPRRELRSCVLYVEIRCPVTITACLPANLARDFSNGPSRTKRCTHASPIVVVTLIKRKGNDARSVGSRSVSKSAWN